MKRICLAILLVVCLANVASAEIQKCDNGKGLLFTNTGQCPDGYTLVDTSGEAPLSERQSYTPPPPQPPKRVSPKIVKGEDPSSFRIDTPDTGALKRRIEELEQQAELTKKGHRRDRAGYDKQVERAEKAEYLLRMLHPNYVSPERAAREQMQQRQRDRIEQRRLMGLER